MSSSKGSGGYKQWLCDTYNSLVPLAAWRPLHRCIYDDMIVADSDFDPSDELLIGAPVCLFLSTDGLFHTGRLAIGPVYSPATNADHAILTGSYQGSSSRLQTRTFISFSSSLAAPTGTSASYTGCVSMSTFAPWAATWAGCASARAHAPAARGPTATGAPASRTFARPCTSWRLRTGCTLASWRRRPQNRAGLGSSCSCTPSLSAPSGT